MKNTDFSSELIVPETYEQPKKSSSDTKKKQENPWTVRLDRINQVRFERIMKFHKLPTKNATWNYVVEKFELYEANKERFEAFLLATGSTK